MPIDARERLAALTDEQRQVLARRLVAGKGRGAPDGPVGYALRHPRGASDLVPLSYAQQRIWFLNQIDSSSTAWNVGRPIRLRGELDADALTRAHDEIIRRHDSLRTIFPVTDGVPAQRVLPFAPSRIDVVDLEHLPRAERGADALRQIGTMFRQAWDLEAGPLTRARLWRLGDTDHIFLFLIHHILADGWSHGLVESELTALYEAFHAGRPSPLPELPIQYPDFAAWQPQWIASADYQRQLDYWKTQLAHLPKTELAADRAARTVTGAGIVRHIVLTPEETGALKALCRREGATLFMGLMAAFAALLSRYSRQDDVVIGSPIANRNRTELENVIGCFMNPLPMRFDVSGDPSFATLLRRVRDVSLAVYAHQDVPFDLLVRTLQPKRDPTTPPLFQVMMLLQNSPYRPFGFVSAEGTAPDRLDELDELLERAELESLRTDLVYPVAIEAYERGSQLLCVFNYDAAFATIFSHAHEHFRLLIASAVANPEQPVAAMRVMGTAEERVVLSRDVPAAASMPLAHRRFESEAEKRPDAPAIVAGDVVLTYADLNRRANQLAHRLIDLGVVPDARVAILLKRSPEMVVGMLAVLKAGGAYVPLDPAYPAERLSFMMRDSGATLLVTAAALLAEMPGLAASAGALPIVHLDSEADALLRLDETTPAVEPARLSLAYVIYTSGSTGTPKGVPISHDAVANYTEAASRAFVLTSADRVLQFASISFDTATEEIYPCLGCGATLVLRTDEMLNSVPLFLRNCAEWGITIVDLPTAYWHELAAEIERRDLTLPGTVRLVILGGERARPDATQTWQSRFGARVRLLNTYGPTEATVVSTMFEVPSEAAADASVEVPIGRAIPGARAYVLDPYLQPATIGAPGELHIGGVGLSRGYLNRPDLTAEKFVPDPFAGEPGARLYKTGDLARVLADGTIQFLGRIDHQIKLRGYRIELAEIETVLRRDPEVADAVVVLRDDRGGRRLVAYVVGRGHESTAANVRRRLRETLPEYMVPAAIVVLPALPMTPAGKVNRDALPEPDAERQSVETYAAPQTEVQHKLTAIWQELLGVDRVGIDDNFFDLGGHSLLVLRLQSHLQQSFRDAPSVIDLFRFSTIRSLAERLTGADAADRAAAPEAEAPDDRADRQRQGFRRFRAAARTGTDRP